MLEPQREKVFCITCEPQLELFGRLTFLRIWSAELIR
jgi:hypothetical protein